MAIVFHDWREENKRRKYPFADNVTADNGTLAIPDGLFIDGRLYPIGGNADLYLSRITRDASDMTFAIRATGTDELATATFDLTDVPSNGELTFFDGYGRPAGILLSSSTELQAFSGVDIGVYEYTLAQTQFAAIVVVPQPSPCLRGILLEDGQMLTGEVWLVGEDGIILRREDDAIRVDVVGDPFASRKLCTEQVVGDTDVQALTPYCPIMTINGVAPDQYGNFSILPGGNQSRSNILRIEAGSQAGSEVTEHLGGAGTLRFATLTIKLLGQRKFSGL